MDKALSAPQDDEQNEDHVIPAQSARAWEHGSARLSGWQWFKFEYPIAYIVVMALLLVTVLGLLVGGLQSVPATRAHAVTAVLSAAFDVLGALGIAGMIIFGIFSFFGEAFSPVRLTENTFTNKLGAASITLLLGHMAIEQTHLWVAENAPKVDALIAPEPEPAWWEVWK